MTDIAKSAENNTSDIVKSSLSRENTINYNASFDARLLMDSFSKSLIKKNETSVDYDDVLIREYLIAYGEFVKFLEYLGQLFYFVVVDVKEKIVIMQNYLESNPENYETISKLVKFEHGKKMFENNGPAFRSSGGARTILRLHRALIFIYKFLERLHSAEQKVKSSQLCIEAYESTLAKYHSWIIRKTVKFGVIALPKRETLLDYMSSDKEELNKCFPILISKVEKVYDITQKIYEQFQILELI